MTTSELDKFGRFIKQQRQAQGLTQEQLAFESDLAAQTILKIEHGRRSISSDTIYKLSAGLDLDITELLLRYVESLNSEKE